MNDRDELQELWLSQPVKTGVPDFGLLDDVAVPVHFPFANRLPHVFVFLLWAWFFGHQLTSAGGWLEVAGIWGGLAAAFVGLLLVAFSRPRPVDSPADESVAAYRARLAREYLRQARSYNRVVFMAMIPMFLAAALVQIGRDEHRFLELLVLLVCAIGTVWWAQSRARKLHERTVRRLRSGG